MVAKAVLLDKIASLASLEEVEGFRWGLAYQGYLLQPDVEDALRNRHIDLLRAAIAAKSKR